MAELLINAEIASLNQTAVTRRSEYPWLELLDLFRVHKPDVLKLGLLYGRLKGISKSACDGDDADGEDLAHKVCIALMKFAKSDAYGDAERSAYCKKVFRNIRNGFLREKVRNRELTTPDSRSSVLPGLDELPARHAPDEGYDAQDRADLQKALEVLTPFEQKIVAASMDQSVEVGAEQLGIPKTTFHRHLRKVIVKLGYLMRSRAALIGFICLSGWFMWYATGPPAFLLLLMLLYFLKLRNKQ